MLKIDFIISSLTSGGAERVVVNLANYFAARNYQVRLLTFDNVQDAYEISPKVQRVRYDKKLILFNFTSVKCLLFLLSFYFNRSNRPDIISSHKDF